MRETLLTLAAAAALALPAVSFSGVAPERKAPPGASALCRDGTYSFSHHRRGTCSWHGGVKKWLRHLPP